MPRKFKKNSLEIKCWTLLFPSNREVFTLFLIFFLLLFSQFIAGGQNQEVLTGLDQVFSPPYESFLKGKKIGLLTNHTGLNRKGEHAIHLFKQNQKKGGYVLKALFAPEHGLMGNQYAEEKVKDGKTPDALVIYSLHGATRRPTPEMLKGIDLVVFDIQDIGSRSYTYVSSLFYVMEEAAKHKIEVLVLDRPNPINGKVVDGAIVENQWRSFIGYANVPYCHGMTVGELARYFNKEYKVGCQLSVIPMRGWKRNMEFSQTGLVWIPTSPNIPEKDTPLYYPITGILGEIQNVSIGVGYSLPFKVVGAPWINADLFAEKLQAQNFPGIEFYPFHFKPFFGRYAKQDCQGVLIQVTDPEKYRPIGTFFLILGMLKSLYPKEFKEGIDHLAKRKKVVNKLTGSEQIYDIITKQKFFVWNLMEKLEKERNGFLRKRKPFLFKEYEI